MSDFESLYGVDEILNGNVYNHKSDYLHFRFVHLDISTSRRRMVPIVVFYYFKYVVLKDRHTYTICLREVRVTFMHYIKSCRRMFGMYWRSNVMDPAVQISRRMSSREEELQRVVRFEWMQVQQRDFKTRNLILLGV
jgi:hypothetical protein